jgi:polyisoprenoid-binding protein YceI
MTAPATRPVPSTATLWVIDPSHSLIEFSIKDLLIATVKGRFNIFGGTISFDPTNPTLGSVAVAIDVASISTGVDQRDARLRSADFFDVDQYAAMSFQSTHLEHVEKNNYCVHGNLTIRGITHQVTLDMTYNGSIADLWGRQRIGFSASTILSRKASGLAHNAGLEAGGMVLGDAITVEIHLEAVQQH